MRTTDLGFTKTKNHHRSGPRQHNTTTDLGRNNTAQHNTILEKVDDDLVLVHKDPKECERIQSLKKIQLKEWSMVVTKTLPPTMIAPSSHQSTMKISPFLNKTNNTHYHLHHLHLHRRLIFIITTTKPIFVSSLPFDSTASDPQPAPPSSDSQVK